MATTQIGRANARAVQRWSTKLLHETKANSVWKNLIGKGEGAETPVIEMTDLKRDTGEAILVQLAIPIKGEPVYGDDRLEGTEAALSTYTDEVYIDLLSKSVDCGGIMTRKRTPIEMRGYGQRMLSRYFSDVHDQLLFMYAGGARGVNTDFHFPTSFTGHAGNAFEAPDSNHILYGGAATSKASMVSTDTFDLTVVEKARTKIRTLGGDASEIAEIQPIMVGGKPTWVFMLHEWQLHKLRTVTGEGKWLDLQKNLATANAEKNAIFTGGEAMHAGMILRGHKNVIRFSDYGAGSNVAAARAFVLGQQAISVAYGNVGNGYAADWTETLENRGGNPIITGRLMVGVKKLRSNSQDTGMLTVDTAAAAP